ncbi:holin [Kitasatospora sp. HPMI-4]|uniref:holin n=1 Tax=Kitasatospora sp. HPMI-4 TaxID=3448443 RepID=UPI003F1A8F4C
MTRHRAYTICTVAGCPEYTTGGRCDEHRRAADRARGTTSQRGYGRGHRTRFRPAVLARDPVCVLCKQQPSQHADHWPLSRRELVDAGMDPDDPQHGRGLCQRCHARSTAAEQPGGWNAR